MAKTKTKYIAIALSIFTTMLFFSSCGGPKPTEVADTFLTALKTQDAEKIAEVYSGGELDLINETYTEEAEEETADSSFDAITEEQLIPKMLEFDYELSNEQIDGDKATVDVKISTYRIGDAFSSFIADYMSQALILAFSDATEEDMDALASTLLSGKVADMTEKTYEKTVPLSLTKVDDKWMVDKLEPAGEFVDALTGGLATSFKTIDDAFSNWGEEAEAE